MIFERKSKLKKGEKMISKILVFLVCILGGTLGVLAFTAKALLANTVITVITSIICVLLSLVAVYEGIKLLINEIKSLKKI